MAQRHEYDVTLSPKGQVATARCSCGWTEKFRQTAGSSPVADLAEAAAAQHAPGAAPRTRGSTAAYDVGQEQDPERLAVEYSEGHVVLPPDLPASPARSRSRGVVAWAAVLVVVAGLCLYLLVRPASDDASPEPSAGTPPPRVFTSEPTPSAPAPSASAPEPSPPRSSAAPALDTRLADEADATAELYGYTLPGSVGEGAALAEITCERALDGWDYETAVADDISVGAPREAAVGWNTFVYEEFCPSLG